MRWPGFGIMVALASCGPQQQPPPPTNNASAPVVPAPSAPPAVENKARPATSLPEPRGPIDPKSVEAAGQVVQHYGALIEQQKFDQAVRYWGDAGAAGRFAKELKPGVHLQIGDLAETEGAAGSIYTTVPVVFYGTGYRRPASVILRRVNDVPGSTEAQRRWHIERIEWADAG